MKIVHWQDLSEIEKVQLLQRPSIAGDESILEATRSIVTGVRERGNIAVHEFTNKFDSIELNDFSIPADRVSQSPALVSSEAKAAIDQAYNNISAFHKKQGYTPFSLQTMDGITCARQVRSYDTVGLYVPGGSAPLISTTLMIGIPAQIAGCKTRVLCTPCDKEGNINPHILYAAHKCGITKVYRIGGAQAIAAMAYGTASIPKCEKIFGPGNAYVTAAKGLVSSDSSGAAIDMPAGPSEVLVIVDETSNAEFAAADLLSQAEHDALSQVILISTSNSKIEEVLDEINVQITKLPRKDIASKSIMNSLAIVVSSMNEAFAVSNIYAPEHLVLCFDSAENYLDLIQNAGSVFVGPYSCESAGDYASGTNHVLPTYGFARKYSGLNVEAFQKTITFQTLTKEGLNSLGDTIETLASLEGLEAHRQAVSRRRK